MQRARRNTKDRQIELVDAALHIVATRGIAALSTKALAERVGLTTGAIFRHFPSLDALLDALVTRVEAVLDATYPPSGLDARDRLDRFIEARSSAVGAQLGILRLVVSEQFLLSLPKEGSARLAACVKKTHAFVRRAIREGQAEGLFRDDVSEEALVFAVMGTMQMLALSAATGGPAAKRRGLTGLWQLLAPVVRK